MENMPKVKRFFPSGRPYSILPTCTRSSAGSEDRVRPFAAVHDWSMRDNRHKLKQESLKQGIRRKNSLCGQSSCEAGCPVRLCSLHLQKVSNPTD